VPEMVPDMKNEMGHPDGTSVPESKC
jgi:hypothetical protein